MTLLGRCALAAAADRMGRCAGRDELLRLGFGANHTEVIETLCAKFD